MPAATARARRQAPPDVDTAQALARFPFRFEIVPISLMFVDRDYQRQLTGFVDRIEEGFNPALVMTLCLSLRSSGKYAIIDGQTRMVAAERLGFDALPSLVYLGLSKQQEAEIFSLIQTERRAVKSWDRFRAALISKNPETLAIKALVESAGFKVGPNSKNGEIGAIAPLEFGFRRDEFQLERTLVNLKVAFPDWTPDGQMIRGLFWFFHRTASNLDVDDERLSRRLRVVGVEELKLRAAHKRAGAARRGSAFGYLAEAILDAYRRG